MKRIYIVALGLLTFVRAAQAQSLDRTKLPVEGPAPTIKIGKSESFTLANGLKVFVVQNNKLPRVTFNLLLDYVPFREGDKAGYATLAGQLLRTGTKTRSRDELDEAVDFIGASLNTTSIGVSASSLKKHTPKLLELVSDIVLHPKFTQEELDKLKKQTKSALASQKDDPTAIATRVSSMLTYGKDHPYGEPDTEETIDRITLEDCQKFYETYYRPNIGYLAVVGDITLGEARSLVGKYFGAWKPGEVPKPKYEAPKGPEKTKVVVVDRPAAVQSVIYIIHPVSLKPYTTESIQASLMNDILGGAESRLFTNLREKRGFTYGAYSSLTSDPLVGRFRATASVRNAATDSAIVEFLNELKNIRDTKPTLEELKRTKSAFAGNFIFTLEDPQTIANFAINTARYNLPKGFFTNYLKNVAVVTDVNIQAMATKLIQPDHAYIVVVGKVSEVAEKLKKFGEISYYDINGNNVEAPTPAKVLPAGLTAEHVFDKYLQAIGGKDAVAKINDVTYKMTTEIQGRSLEIETRQKMPNKFALSVTMMGQEVQKVVADGNKVAMSGIGGQSKTVEGDEAKSQILQNSLFPELLLTSSGAKATLVSTEKVNGKDTYKVDVLLPGEKKFTEYFDIETGLKVQIVAIEKGPQGEVTVTVGLDNYKEIDGVKFPHTRSQNAGPMQMKMEVQSIQVNKGLEDKFFQI